MLKKEMGAEKKRTIEEDNGFALSDRKMDYLIKEAVKLELKRKKISDLPITLNPKVTKNGR